MLLWWSSSVIQLTQHAIQFQPDATHLCACHMFKVGKVQLSTAVIKHMDEFMGQDTTCRSETRTVVLTNYCLKPTHVPLIIANFTLRMSHP